MSAEYKILYLFENPEVLITQIMRLDLGKNADALQVYHWLHLDKKTKALVKLWLQFEDSSSAIQERFFEQGYLKFNTKEATYIEKYNSSQAKLTNFSERVVGQDVRDQIDSYLSF